MTEISISSTRSPVRLGPPPRTAIAAAAVSGLAAWVSGGSLAVTGASVSTRVGLLPPWWVPVAVASAVLVAASLLPIARRAWLALLFPGILLLPWLPLPLPAAILIWSGPIAAWVWAATGVSFVLAARRFRPTANLEPRNAGNGAGAIFASASRAPRMAFAAAFLAFVAGWWLLAAQLPGGDEPHYLVITQSLLKDGDLRIENNHRQGDYRAYFDGELRPDYLRRGKDGQIYSIHAPGLPALIAPAFAVGGYPAVVLLLAMVSALGTALLWRVAFTLTASAQAAWFGWAVVTMSAPFFFHAFQVFPDAPGAVLTLTGVAALARLATTGEGSAADTAVPPRPALLADGTARWALHGAALATLPWLHTRYAIVAGVLGAAIGLRLVGRRAWRPLLAFALLPIVSAAAWFGFFYAIYGQFSPAAPYGSYTQSSLASIPRGLTGLLFDQQFGILPYAPAYALALAGFVSLGRRRPRLAVELALLAVIYLAATATYHMWWGGHSAAARFAVPVLLMLGVPAAAWWSASARARAVGIAALAWTMLVTWSLAASQSGNLVFNDRDGFARWLEWLSPAVDLPTAVPSVFHGPRSVLALQVAAWLAVMLAASALVRFVAARRSEQALGRIILGVPWLFALAVTCGGAVGWASAGRTGSRVLSPTSSQMQAIRAFDPARRPLAIDFERDASLSPAAAVLPRLHLATAPNRPLPAAAVLLVLGDVPAGAYRLDPASLAGARGSLSVTFGRSPEPVLSWAFAAPGAAPGPILRLPLRVDRLTITGDSAAVSSIRSLALQPIAVVPPSQLLSPQSVSRAFRYGSLLAYPVTAGVHPEPSGLWVEAGIDGGIVFSTASPARSLRLLARNGPVDNVVRLRAGKWEARLQLAPGAEQVVDVPVDEASLGALVEAHAERGFVPAKVDPRSGDRRDLGVWLEPAR